MQIRHFCLFGILATVTFGLSTKTLKFSEDGTFKICQITDTHFGKDQNNNLGTQNVIRTVLKSEDPNIVVITGDIISGYEWDNTKGWYGKNYDQVVAPMNELDYNWAITLGNHDHQADLTPEGIRQLDMSYERSMTKSSVHNISHTFNYILPIYDSTETQIVARIWIFDVGSQDCYGIKDWDCIKPDQIEWYRRESQKIPLDDPYRTHGFAFFHIPTQEWDDLYNNFPVYGGKGEQVLCPTINTGLFAAFKEQGTVEYAFVGHDHTNDYWGNYYGVNLGFGRRTGVGDFKQQGQKIKVGGRIFELQLNPWKVDTWIRNLDGEQEIQQKKKHPNYEFKVTQVQSG